MRIRVFLFSQHGIRAIKEFENIKVRVSPCDQFRQSIHRLCHTPVALQSSRKPQPPLEYLAAGNFLCQDFPTTSIPVDEHTNRSVSLGSTLRWKPRRKILLHEPISNPALKFTRWCVAACEALLAKRLLQ